MSGQFDAVHQRITDKFVELMGQGVIPWRQTWMDQAGALSYATGQAYSGINLLNLTFEAIAKGYTSPFWMTFDEAKRQGAMVKKGETSMPIYWSGKYSYHKKGDADDAPMRQGWREKWWNVFNLDQLTDIKYPRENKPREVTLPENVIAFLDCIPGGARVVHGHNPAYSPLADTILMPEAGYFVSANHYLDARFHETAHSTGHASRLNREGVVKDAHFGSKRYGQEELVATFAQAMLMNHFGLEMPEIEANTAAYLKGWAKAVKNDNEMIIRAGRDASKAVKWMLNEREEAKHGSELLESAAD